MTPKKNLLYIGNKLSKKGNTITSIETLGSLLEAEGYKIIMVSSVKNKFLRLLHMLYVTFKNRNKVSNVLIDTYSTQNFYYAVGVGIICRLFKTPYIPILRGGNLNNRLENDKIFSVKFFQGAKTNVVPSKFLMEKFKNKGFENLSYIPNSLEIDRYSFKTSAIITPKLLWVRSFSEIYNPILALQIVEILTVKGVEVSLTMVGPEKDGSLQQCKKIVDDLNLPVTFTGILNKNEWINLAKEFDIFINTTNFDNMPISVMEAMALGLPVISTNVGGLPYLIENEIDGILVAPNNADGFVNAIENLCKNPLKTKEITQNARKKVEAFDWQIIKHKWNDLLNS